MDKITRRNLLGKILIGGLAGGLGLTGLAGCKDKGVVEKEEFTLYVSQQVGGPYWMMYCGMPNEKTFSLSVTDKYYATLYYPKDAKQILFNGANYDVVSVDPNKITLKEIKE